METTVVKDGRVGLWPLGHWAVLIKLVNSWRQ